MSILRRFVLLGLLLFLTACETNDPEPNDNVEGDACPIVGDVQSLDYDDFSDHELDSFDDSLTISDNLHFEYYYSPYCSHCQLIKTDMLNFFANHADIEYYLINSSEATGLPKIDSYRGTPSLYVVADNEVVMEIVGSEAIPIFIADYCSGEIDLSEYE